MVMNCIGVNNYHLFLQMICLIMVNMLYQLGLNVYYNFWVDFDFYARYWWVLVPAFLVGLVQAGAVWYAYGMGTWYFGMASRNMHAIEETIAGSVYNKSDALAITGDRLNKTYSCKSK